MEKKIIDIEERDYTIEGLIQELKDEKIFSNLSDEGLKYMDNIVSNIVKLKELQHNSDPNSIGSMWFIFIMYLLSSPVSNAMSAMASLNPSSDETNKE